MAKRNTSAPTTEAPTADSLAGSSSTSATNNHPTVIPPEFIRKAPKSDLHVHLDGSIRLGTLIELAKERNVELPSYTEDGLVDLVFKDRYGSLKEYLQGFQYTTAVLQDEEALERAAYELAEDNMAEGVRYIEVRFAPHLHVNPNLDMTQVLWAVHRGLKKAKDLFNDSTPVRQNLEPPFEYGMIVCAMRMFTENMSDYYNKFLQIHRYSQRRKVYGLASLELAQAVVAIRNEYGLPIVGFDLAGQERGYPAVDHLEAYRYAHKNFLKKTVHAGEAYGPESIFQAITDLHADRIGHGYHLLSSWLIEDEIANKNEYVRALAEYIADRRITIEVCLTSNLQTNPRVRNLNEHAFRDFQNLRLSTTFCTDNRTVSSTTVSREIELACQYFNLTPSQLRNSIIYGFKRSFFPGTYRNKRNYVRQIIDYYEKIEEEFGLHEKDDQD
ncbi:MAG: adenosine deaminase family protein [Bradymonadales bacterium]|nr:adenosine deaminase family protein [Bradymonadales bacterium]